MNLKTEAKEIIQTVKENRFYAECPCCGESIQLKKAGLFYLNDFTPEAESLDCKKIDPIFTPRKLNPDDAKVIFHPIDYIVFNGMKENSLKNIVLLDREAKISEHRKIQRSIEKVIGTGNYEWQTLRVMDDGKIREEW